MALALDHPAQLSEDGVAGFQVAVADRRHRPGIVALLPLDLGQLRHRQARVVFQHGEHVAVPVYRLVLLGVALEHDTGIQRLRHRAEPVKVVDGQQPGLIHPDDAAAA